MNVHRLSRRVPLHREGPRSGRNGLPRVGRGLQLPLPSRAVGVTGTLVTTRRSNAAGLQQSIMTRAAMPQAPLALAVVAQRTVAVMLSGAVAAACDEPTLPAHCEAVPGYELPPDCTAIIERINDHSTLYWTIGVAVTLGAVLGIWLVRRHNQRQFVQREAEARVRRQQEMEIRLAQAMQAGRYAEALTTATDMYNLSFLETALTRESAATLARLGRVVATLHLLQDPPDHPNAAHVLFEFLPRVRPFVDAELMAALDLALVVLRARFATVNPEEVTAAWAQLRQFQSRVTPQSFAQQCGRLAELNAASRRRPWQFAVPLLETVVRTGRVALPAGPRRAAAPSGGVGNGASELIEPVSANEGDALAKPELVPSDPIPE
ncbi:MAG: hypothetical protein HY696_01825 [Deltaproteobacteria bacterium]|nr:hypothetical protein [Deltaproteobacteria bacterium]